MEALSRQLYTIVNATLHILGDMRVLTPVGHEPYHVCPECDVVAVAVWRSMIRVHDVHPEFGFEVECNDLIIRVVDVQTHA